MSMPHPDFCCVVHACTPRHKREAHAGSNFAATRTSLGRLTPSLLAAMAPKAIDAAYVNRDVPLPDARRNDWGDIARFLAMARLDLDVVQRFEQECSMWRANMFTPLVMALTPSRSVTPAPKPKAPPAGFEGDAQPTPKTKPPPAGLEDVPDDMARPAKLWTSQRLAPLRRTAATEVIYAGDPIHVLPPGTRHPVFAPSRRHRSKDACTTPWGSMRLGGAGTHSPAGRRRRG